MIFEKANPIPQNHNRYEQCFEYMIVFSKGKPSTFNPIKVPTKNAGKVFNWEIEKLLWMIINVVGTGRQIYTQ